jgi:hypothetical protein
MPITFSTWEAHVLRSAWRFLADINLSIWLLLAISFNLAIGSQYAKYTSRIEQLNTLRFQDWILLNGLPVSWWVWSLFILLFLFAINTAVCTSDRLLFLIRRRTDYRFASFALTVSPSIMHLSFLIIIGGHAISQFTADIRLVPVTPGTRFNLSSSTVTVLDSRCSFRTEPELAGQVRECGASLALSSPAGTITRDIGVLRPVVREGYSIHLILDGRPKPGEIPARHLIIKRDPGLPLIIFGNALLCLLMLWYFPVIIRNRNAG